MILTKTIKIKILPNKDQALDLLNLCNQYCKACNYVSEYIFNNGFNLNSNSLSLILYKNIRDLFGLKSQISQSVIRSVTASYKIIKKQLVKNPLKFKDKYSKEFYSIPKTLEWLETPCIFKMPYADLVNYSDYNFLSENIISITTLTKRIKTGYVLSNEFKPYFDNTWSFGTAKLLNYNNIWYLYIPVSKEFNEFDKTHIKHVVGIDRGLRFIITEYNEEGKTSFISGKHIIKTRNKFRKLRAQLQHKGTKSAKKILKRNTKRERRWMKDVNHCISKNIVKKYGKNTLFVLEDLTGISKGRKSKSIKDRHESHSWSFFDLERKLIYKAHFNDSEVIKVSAKYTSQRCPKCGTINKDYRNASIHLYECKNCGYKSNDDRLGAMNIQQLGTLWVSDVENPKFIKPNSSE